MLGIYKKVKRFMRMRDTMKELSMMSDRELSDIGISRHNIREVVNTIK